MAEYVIRNIAFSVAGVDLTGDGVLAFSAPLSCIPGVTAGWKKPGVAVSDRGNAAHSITVSVLRRFANDDALEAFSISHAGGLTRAGALVVTSGTTSTTTSTASSCCITSVSIAEPEALILVVTYTITSSPLLAS